MEKEPAWEIIASRRVVETPYLRVRSDSIRLPSGDLIEDYYVRETLGFTIVFALTPEGNVPLVRQYKHGIGQTVLELPAGMIDAGETPETCARRELAEETGYTGALEHAGTFITSPTECNGKFHLFLARNALPTTVQHLDPTEHITVEVVTLAQLRSFVRDGTIDSGPHVAAVYFMLDRLSLL